MSLAKSCADVVRLAQRRTGPRPLAARKALIWFRRSLVQSPVTAAFAGAAADSENTAVGVVAAISSAIPRRCERGRRPARRPSAGTPVTPAAAAAAPGAGPAGSVGRQAAGR